MIDASGNEHAMVRRLSISALAAALMTFCIFFAMQSLVSRRAALLEDSQRLSGINFIRLSRDEAVKRMERRKPKKLDQSTPPPPSAPAIQKGPDPAAMAMKVDIPAFTASIGAGGDGPYLGGATDTDVVPLVRVNAQYPSRAQARGVEGWVHVRFTVTPLGTTSDVEIVDADPRGYFEAAAKNAVQKYRYKPRFEDGQAVDRPGVEVVLSFKLDK
jgi:protein TonB